jgi:hypothetical protein
MIETVLSPLAVWIVATFGSMATAAGPLALASVWPVQGRCGRFSDLLS